MVLALALALTLTLVGSAMAATDGSITISNTTTGKTYTAYKVFSATYSGSNVSYFYDGSNATFLSSLRASTSPFTLTGPVDGVYNVIRKDNIQDSAIIAFIKDNADNLGTGTTKNGNGGSLVFDGLDYGYYYISTTNGTAVTIDSALKDVTVIDKNQGSTLDKQEQIATQGYYIDENGHKTEDPIPTANVGDTINYKVVGKFTQYQGEKKVVAFKWVDTMSAGLTAKKDVVIKIKSTGDSNFRTLTKDTDYTVTYSADTACVTTINIPTVNATSGAFLFGSVTEYEITYSATLNETAITTDIENNTVDFDYTEDNTKWTDVDTDETKVKDYKITLTKEDASTKEKLADAHFELYDALTGGNKIPLVLVPNTAAGATYGTKDSTVNNVYRHAKTGETSVEMVVGKTGIIEIEGLANGNYYFEETAAPNGYNRLTARTPVTTITNANATITVDNSTGSELPSTGGIGTTIFYIAGLVIVLGAAAVIIARRKAEQN